MATRLWFGHQPARVLSARISYAFLFLALVLMPQVLRAQWTKIWDFGPNQVRSIYFLDKQGSASTGFVGSFSGIIYRTQNGGTTWAKMNHPQINGSITDFCFKDKQTGWCTVRPGFSLDPGLYKTVDGGSNWTPVSALQGTLVCVYYHAPTGRLIINSWSGNSVISTDDGNTFVDYGDRYLNGITAMSNNDIMSSIWSQSSYHYSGDGGASWGRSAMAIENWQPCGIPGTKTVFLCGEKNRQIHRSDDGGINWTYKYTFPSNVIPTGHINGNLAALYVQTSEGFYLSTDQGSNWTSICGPPNGYDTRFYLQNNKAIYAGDDNGALWFNNDPASPDLSIDLIPPRLDLTTDACHEIKGTVRFRVHGSCEVFYNQQILETVSPTGVFTVSSPGTLPRLIVGTDSFEVTYDPRKASFDTAIIRLRFTINGRPVDTFVTVIGVGTSKLNLLMTTTKLDFKMFNVCVGVDSSVTIFNQSCDTVDFTDAKILDTTYFKLFGMSLPVRLLPHESAKALVHAFGPEGKYTTTLKLRLKQGTRIIDTTVELSMNVVNSVYPVIPKLDLALNNRCKSIDTAIRIRNPRCDTLIIDSLSLTDIEAFALAGYTLPILIPPGEQISLPVHIEAHHLGTYSSTLKIRSRAAQTGSFDTTVNFSVTAMKPLYTSADVAPLRVLYGPVGRCSQKSSDVKIKNTTCEPYTLQQIVWESSPADFTIVSAPKTPMIMQPGQEETVVVQYAPSDNTTVSALLKVTFELDGESRDTLITYNGTGVTTTSATISADTLQFAPILACDESEMYVWVKNTSCDSVEIVDLKLGTGGDFVLLEPSKGTRIGGGDSVKVRIHLKPRAPGVKNERLDVYLQSADGGETSVATVLLGQISSPVRSMNFSLDQLDLPKISGCTPVDTLITIVNHGLCDTLFIYDVQGTPELTLTNDPLPKMLLPEESFTVRVHLTPQLEGTMVGIITITGNGFVKTIPYTASIVGGSRVMSIATRPDTFKVRLCQPLEKDFTIKTGGCAPSKIDSIRIIPDAPIQTQFTIVTLPTVGTDITPETELTTRVRFNPDGIGDGTAKIIVWSSDASFSDTVFLTSGVFGSHSVMRMQLSAENLPAEGFNAGEILRAPLALLDVVDDTLGLQQVAFDLNYNDDQLTLVKIVADPAWVVADTIHTGVGSWRVLMQKVAPGALGVGSQIAVFHFYVSLGDSTGSALKVSAPLCNPGDPNYERCQLAAFTTSDSIHVHIQPACGDVTLQRFMDKQLELGSLSVHPNPVGSTVGKSAELRFRTAGEMAVRIALLDGLGKEIEVITQSTVGAGDHTIPLNMSRKSEGAYFVALESHGYRVVKKLIVQN